MIANQLKFMQNYLNLMRKKFKIYLAPKIAEFNKSLEEKNINLDDIKLSKNINDSNFESSIDSKVDLHVKEQFHNLYKSFLVLKVLQNLSLCLGRTKFNLYDMDHIFCISSDKSNFDYVFSSIINIEHASNSTGVLRKRVLNNVFNSLLMRTLFFFNNDFISQQLEIYLQVKGIDIKFSKIFLRKLKSLDSKKFNVDEFVDLIRRYPKVDRIEAVFRRSKFNQEYYVLSEEVLKNIDKILNLFSLEDIFSILDNSINGKKLYDYIKENLESLEALIKVILKKFSSIEAENCDIDILRNLIDLIESKPTKLLKN